MVQGGIIMVIVIHGKATRDKMRLKAHEINVFILTSYAIGKQ